MNKQFFFTVFNDNKTMSRMYLERIWAAFVLLVFLFSLIGTPTTSVQAAIEIGFSGSEYLGNPTDTSITINVVPEENVYVYYEYGTSSGTYTMQTPAALAIANEPYEVVISGLQSDTEYYYRMRYAQTESDPSYVARLEGNFHTARPDGSTYQFAITADSHVNILLGTLSQWQTTLDLIDEDNPDFLVDLGDTFAMDGVATESSADMAYLYQRDPEIMGRVSYSVPIFLAMGNHENEEGWNFDDVNPQPIFGMKARKRYFPLPSPLTDPSFYSTNHDIVETSDVANGNSHVIGDDQYRENYYAWEWGDALFVVFDPFQYTMQNPYGTSAGEGNDEVVGGDRWNWTMGVEQHQWLKNTLANSDAKYKFLFAHHMLGGTQNYVRGGAQAAHQFEWGGYNADGTTWGFDTKRPAVDGWLDPVHQLMQDYGVQAFFHGHDHHFVLEERDGIFYQLVPAASQGTGLGFNNYPSSPYMVDIENNSGYLRVTVSPSEALVEYVKSTGTNVGQVQYSYTIQPNQALPVPTITLTNTHLTDFNSETGMPSVEQSYVVSGSSLTEDIVIAAPADFQISLASNSGFGSSLILPQNSGLVSDTTIYVRFNRAIDGSAAGNITHTSAGTNAENVVVTGTAAGAETVMFAAFGDYGYAGVNELAVANMVNGWNPDFIITTGDNTYGATSIDNNIGQYYSNYIGNYIGAYGNGSVTNRFFPSLGNHDYTDGGGSSAYFSYFTLPGNERYFDFERGPIHFFVIDSNPSGTGDAPGDGRSPGSIQGTWLQAQLAASTSPWKIVYMHHPPFSSGSTHGSDTAMQWPFEAWGATAVITGHVHNYERIMRDDDDDSINMPYFVTGLGGRSLYSFGVPVTGSAIRYSADYGSMRVQASDTSVTFEFWSVAGGGTLIDTYTIDAASPAHTITASAGVNGSIDPSGMVSVINEGDQTFTITPDIGYQIANVLVDGVSAGLVAEYTFTSVTADHTISAIFSSLPNRTVTFNNNGGGGTMSPQIANIPTALATNTFTRTGYTFSGWNTAANGSGTSYADGATYSFAANVTLYAQWTALPNRTVTFNNNGGSGTMTSQIANIPTALTTNTFTRTGYTFNGWNTTANGSGTSYADGAIYSFAANVTLYAQWTALPNRTVIFNNNGGSGTMSPQITNIPTALTTNTFIRTGYTFGGWNTTANGTGTSYADGATYSFTTNVTLYAQWNINSYTLEYIAGAGGSLTDDTSQTVNYGANGTAVTAVPNTGYHFVNWSDGSTANPRTDTNVTADVNVTANFAIDTFTLDYVAGAGGSLTGDTSQTVNYGVSGTTVTAVPNTGYHFVNWSDGSTANPRTDTNVTADVNVIANFAETVYPTVNSVVRANANPTNATNITFIVTFTESVTGVDMSDFALTTTGVSGALITNVSGLGETYTVAVYTGAGNGTLRLDVMDNNSIVNGVSDPLGGVGTGDGDFTAGEMYDVEKYTIVQANFSSVAVYDGWILEDGDTNKGGAMNTNSSVIYLGDDAQNRQYRVILHFDTSSLPDNAVIVDAKLRLAMNEAVRGTNPFLTHDKIVIELNTGAYSNSNSLQLGDFRVPSDRNGAGAVRDNLVNGFYRGRLKGDVLEYFNLIEATQIRLRFKTDDDDDNVADLVEFFSGNSSVNSERPRLVIYYYVP